MQKQATGQITLMTINDGNDGHNYMFYLEKNLSTEQIYNEEGPVWMPAYNSTPLRFTPHLTLGGSIPKNPVTYTYTIEGVLVGDSIGSSTAGSMYGAYTDGDVLIISQNMTSNQYVIVCTANFKDDLTNNDCTCQVQETMNRRAITNNNKVYARFDNVDLHAITNDHQEVTMKAYGIYGASDEITNKDDASYEYAVKYSWSIWNDAANGFIGLGAVENVKNGAITNIDPIVTGYQNGVNGTYNYSDFANSGSAKYYLVKETSEDTDNDSKITYFTTTDANASNYHIMIDNNTIKIKGDAIDNYRDFKCEVEIYKRSGSNVGEFVGSDPVVETIADDTDEYGLQIVGNPTAFSSSVNAIKIVARVTKKGIVDTQSYLSVSYDWDAYNIDANGNDEKWVEYENNSGTPGTTSNPVYTAAERGQGYWYQTDVAGEAVFTKSSGIYNDSDRSCSITVYKKSLAYTSAKFICTAYITLSN